MPFIRTQSEENFDSGSRIARGPSAAMKWGTTMLFEAEQRDAFLLRAVDLLEN